MDTPKKYSLITAQVAPGVSFREWSTFAEMMRERLQHHGIAATSDVNRLCFGGWSEKRAA